MDKISGWRQTYECTQPATLYEFISNLDISCGFVQIKTHNLLVQGTFDICD